MGKTVNPNWVSGHYKAIDRSTDTSVGSWVFQSEDTPWTPGTGVYNIGLVIGWGESAGQTSSTSSGTITLQFAVNGGGFTTVTASTAVKYANSAAVTDGGTYGTAYTSAPTGVASWGGTGEYDENNSVSAQTPVDQYFEALFVLEIDPAQLNDNDVLTFQILHGGSGWDSVDTTPQITVNKPNAYSLTAENGTYSITGQTADVLRSKLITANNGTYAVTGQDATVTYTPVTGYEITADAGSYSVTGQDATITYLQNFPIAADFGTYSLTGQTADILKSRILTAENGTYSVSGQNATFTYGIPPRMARLLMEDGFDLLQEDDSYLLIEPLDYIVEGAAGSYTVTGQAATLSRSYEITATHGTYAVSGQDATLSRSYDIAASNGTYSVTGQTADVLKGNLISADYGTYAVSGQTADILKTNILSADAGSYSVTGQDASILTTHLLTADQGTYAVTGQDATVTWTPAGAYELIANQGSYSLTGQSASILKTRILTADAGVYNLTGQSANIERGLLLTADHGSYIVTGNSAIISWTGGATGAEVPFLKIRSFTERRRI